MAYHNWSVDDFKIVVMAGPEGNIDRLAERIGCEPTAVKPVQTQIQTFISKGSKNKFSKDLSPNAMKALHYVIKNHISIISRWKEIEINYSWR